MKSLSIIVPLKNRSRIQVPWGRSQIWIEPFQKNLQALRTCVRPEDQWQIVIVDFGSTDVNLAEMIRKIGFPSNVRVDIHTLDKPFSRGLGINEAFAKGWVLYEHALTLDADMKILTRQFFEDLDRLVGEGSVFFPICWSWKEPAHKTGWKRDSGTGIVAHKTSEFQPLMENKTWGMEDTHN
jgi:glycosyltransferase involved in cell wall biosynthesis